MVKRIQQIVVEKANLLNAFFHSVFNPCDIEPPAYIPTPSETLADNQLSEIELFVEEIAVVLNIQIRPVVQMVFRVDC